MWRYGNSEGEENERRKGTRLLLPTRVVEATGVAEEDSEADATGAKGVKAGEGSSSITSSSSISSNSSSINSSSVSTNSSSGACSINSNNSTRNSNSTTGITRGAGVEVAVGAGGGTHSNGALGAGDAPAGEAVGDMQEVVRKPFRVGEQVYLRTPRL